MRENREKGACFFVYFSIKTEPFRTAISVSWICQPKSRTKGKIFIVIYAVLVYNG